VSTGPRFTEWQLRERGRAGVAPHIATSTRVTLPGAGRGRPPRRATRTATSSTRCCASSASSGPCISVAAAQIRSQIPSDTSAARPCRAPAVTGSKSATRL